RDPVARRRAGVMMQVAKVPDMLRVSEHIDTFRSYYPAPLARAEVLEMAGLGDLERRLFGTLSGGEKQRVLFALALAGNPDLLFLDEPTVGMDVETRRLFRRRIRDLGAEGRTVLLTTHHLEEADALADHVIVLRAGAVVADDSPAAIKRRIARSRIRCVTALAPDMIRALCDVDMVMNEGEATVILCADAAHVLRTLLAHDDSLHGLEVSGAGLEDAFVALTSVPVEAAS
ncbi:MAG TPA: ABC transporter ATP-binding protein, partial [Longimicrobiales bacterium]|nr:ABC transporter ATP-binding protein [Longimicrobiales bacterium]